jgi:hypothetical protein
MKKRVKHLRFVLVILIGVIGLMGFAIYKEYMTIGQLNTRVYYSELRVETLNNSIDNLENELNRKIAEINDLENTAIDGTVATGIYTNDLLSEILGFDVSDSDNYYRSDWYYYSTLNDKQKEYYKNFLESFIWVNHNESFTVNSYDDAVIVSRAVMMDNPTLFWINGYSIKDDGNGNYSIHVNYDDEVIDNYKMEIYNRWVEIQEYKADVFKDFNEFMSDEDKERIIFNYISLHTIYEEEVSNNQNMYSIVKGRSVCSGYAKMFMYLCREAGIKCICVRGTSKETEIGHMWNMVKIGDNNYYVDATNALVTILGNNFTYINNDYFNCLTEQMEKYYNIDKKLTIPKVN